MKNQFKFSYNVFGYGTKYLSSYVVEAETKEEAFITFVAQSNAIYFEKAKELIDVQWGEPKWKINDVWDSLNPLGSRDTELYELLSIRKLRNVNNVSKIKTSNA